MLDLQTLSFSSVVAAIISALFFIMVWRLNRNTPGIGIWMVAVFSQPFGWFFLSLRGEVSDWITIVAANFFIIESMLLFYIGSRLFLKLKHSYFIHSVIFLVLFTIILTYFTMVIPSITVRITLMYGTTTLIMLANIQVLLNATKEQKSAGLYIFSTICIIIALLTSARLIASVLAGFNPMLFDFSLGNLIGSLLGFVIPYGMTLSIYILCNEQRISDIARLKRAAVMQAKETENHLAILSHELRTPLNAIVGKAQLMRENAISNEVKTDCDIIIDSGTSLATLANQVLQYYSLNQTNDIKSNNQNINIELFLKQVIGLLSPLAKEKDLKLTLHYEELPQNVNIDSDKLRQVLINLIGNAIKFTTNGTICLSVKITPSSEQRPENLTFSITDTGIGIPTNEQTTLLSPFQQASNHSDAQINDQGVGLGLNLTQHLLRSMNSELSFTSIQAVGSQFWFNIPYSVSSLTNSAPQSVENIIHNLNILLVEDIPLNQNIAKAMLDKDNHQVTIVSSAQGALSIIKKQTFDLILLDMQLPDAHGLNLLKKIRGENTTNKGTITIALTATITPSAISSYHQLGIHQVIEKPILLDKLREAIYQARQKLSHQSTVPLINEPPLNFMLDNLPHEFIEQALSEIPSRLDSYFEQLTTARQAKDQLAFKKILHHLLGYTSQLGLARLAQKIKLYESQWDNEINIDTLVSISKPSINALNEYSKRYHESK